MPFWVEVRINNLDEGDISALENNFTQNFNNLIDQNKEIIKYIIQKVKTQSYLEGKLHPFYYINLIDTNDLHKPCFLTKFGLKSRFTREEKGYIVIEGHYH
ncbi:alpha 2 protein [Adelaide River virus]|uniref:Protein alpha-2 n=2 Tax=Adelaide River virus TaxID=31612 RepID=VPA2_ARV|nr:alpha 2 protein [Adelaide River virus]Q65108.1 RecName: Full=Protein alpha-2 [Adelaide River virus]AAA50192.1 alpha2 protein [Adelaide River virus]AFR23538.1 alpha 2 protein [Adelaide River virus]